MSLLTLPQRVLHYGQPVNRTAPLISGLVSWWLTLPQRGKGNTWFDLCGKNHGTLTGGPTWSGALGRPGGWGAVNTNGTNYVAVPSNASLQQATDKATYAMSVKTTGTEVVALDQQRDGDQDIFQFYLPNSSSVRAAFTGTFVTSSVGVSDGSWHRMLATYDGSAIKIYIDGQLSGSEAKVGSLNYGTPRSLFFGQNYGDVFRLTGAFDNIALWNRAFTDSDAASEYQASLTGYQQELNYYRRQYIFDVGAGGGGGGAVPALDQGMLTGGLSTLCGGLA